MRLDWKAAFAYPFRDPDWKPKLFVGGLLMLLCPPVGWTMALGYRRAVGIRLRAGMTPPLPLPPLYSYLFPWVNLTPLEIAVLVIVFVATAFVLPAAFVQVSVTGRYRSAFRVPHVARFITGHPIVYGEAWLLSLTASAIGVAMGPLAPWGLFWSYIVILHAFMEAFLRSGREDVIAAFRASPLLRQLDSTPLATNSDVGDDSTRFVRRA